MGLGSSAREVITIQKFLEAAARQETSGKVRIQHFIEDLLRRIALAEELVEYYQVNGSPQQCNHYKVQRGGRSVPHHSSSLAFCGITFTSYMHGYCIKCMQMHYY